MSAETPKQPEVVLPPKGFTLKHLTLLPSLPDNVFLITPRKELPDDAA